MTDENLLTIGAFGMLTGLSVTTLRHYDDVGILQPAFVDPGTKYRYYRPDQVRAARLISVLRSIDLPVDEIKDVIEAEDDDYVRVVLADHRDRLSTRTYVLSQQIEALDELIEKGVEMTTMVKGARFVGINIPADDLEATRKFYEEALDCEFAAESHDDGPEHLNTTFGEWGKDNWFLFTLWPNKSHAGTANIGFLVEDLDASYKKALAAGATDIHPPMDKPGMPRNAYVKDPSGNILGLYQG